MSVNAGFAETISPYERKILDQSLAVSPQSRETGMAGEDRYGGVDFWDMPT
jgi:hypothetical protein